MQVIITDGYVSSYAFVGSLDGGLEVDIPSDMDHFFNNYESYKLTETGLVFDQEKFDSMKEEEDLETLRERRQTECFEYVDRGALWYDTLTAEQLIELGYFYRAWLNVTETKVVPEKPTWLT